LAVPTLVVFLLAPALATVLPGDFFGDFDFEDFKLLRSVLALEVEEPEASGVGGRSANIIWTCHNRFSSSNLNRSA
jgi:hypothetical protein